MSDSKQNPDRLPTFFSFHGGGPSFFMPTIKGDRWENISKDSAFANFLRSFTKEQLKGQKPKAILVISGHWDSYEVEVNACARHSLYYDYYGFPDYTYNLDYPAVGDPQLAERVAELLKTNTEFPVALNKERGLDHGVFVPLMLMFPEADVPIIQVSLHRSFNYADHIKLGEALAPLRDEGVLIYGSGALTHGFRSTKADVAPFVDWCKDTLSNPELSVEERNKRLGEIAQVAPGYRAAHPTPDHLIPLHTAVGAANSKPGTIVYDGWSGQFSLFAIRFD